jgi:hypothetical protein
MFAPSKHLLEAIEFGAALADERGAIAGELPEFALGPVGNEARLEEPVA